MTKWHIFLINGLAQNARHWNPQLLDTLRQLSCVGDVVPLDLPGAGRLSHHRSPTRIPQYVPLMRQFYEAELAAAGPRLVVALSLGGMVASEWCQQFPDDFQKLLLVNTSFGRFAAARERLQPAAWLTFASVFLGRSRAARERRTLELVSNDPEKRAAILPVWIEARRKHPTARINALRQLLAARHYKAPDRLPKETVVVCSRHDRLCHYTASEKIARHYQLPLIVDSTPTIGHAFHVDGAEELATIIENCVAERLVSAQSDLRVAGRA